MKLKSYRPLFQEASTPKKPFSDKIGIYVASLYDYNAGKLVGEWFDLMDYSDADELMEAIEKWMTDLNKKSKDGVVREEWAIHDSEIPDIITEGSGMEDFEKFYRIKQIAEERDIPADVITTYMEDHRNKSGLEDLIAVVESGEDYAYEYVQEMGKDVDENFLSRYVEFDDVYISQLASEMADSDRESITDELETDKENELYDVQNQIDELEKEIEDLQDKEEDGEDVSREISAKEKEINALEKKKKDIESDYEKQIEEAVEERSEQYYSEINRDPLEYHTRELGYDMKEIMRVASIDYKSMWDDMSSDYNEYYSKETKKYYIFLV